jgi:transmembrane sensor
MSGRQSMPVNSESVRAEAAAWIARLHGPQRTPELEAGLRRWIAENPAHAQVFERMTEAWDDATALAARERFPRIRNAGESSGRRFRPLALVSVLLIVCGVAGFLAWRAAGTYVTDVGEQRQLRLDDGSRVTINSASRLVVKYSESMREVSLEHGEAFFEVEADRVRPFIVSAGGRRVVALGTAFSVRYDAGRLAVTLVDGKVAVSDPDDDPAPVALTPGERLTVAKSARPQIDTPRLETVTAWRRGEIVLEKTTLREALEEMNRYDSRRLEVEDAQTADLLISGIYRTGDNAGFAHAIARMYRLELEESEERIELRPSAP